MDPPAPRLRSLPRWLRLAIALLAAGCGPEEKSAPIDPKSISIELGAGGLWRDGRWTQALVRARTKEKLFHGDVEVSGLDERGDPAPERFHKRFEVAGESQAIEIPALPRGWNQLVVTFRGEGISAETVIHRISSDPEVKFRILVIGKPPFAALPAVFVDSLKCSAAEIEVKAIAPKNLPHHFLGYQAADLVIVVADSLVDADLDGRGALQQWVERGGTLAAVPGPSWGGKLPPDGIGLFGLRDASRTANDGGPAAIEGRAMEESAGEQPQFFTLAPLPGASLIDHGFLLEHRAGNGIAYLHALAWPGIFPNRLWKPGGLYLAWEHIVERAVQSQQESIRLDEQFEPKAIRALSKFSGLRYPSRTKAILFVGAYVAIGIAAGLIFGRARRLERMYLIATVVAVLSSIGIWRFGLLSGIQEFGVDEITVARVRPGTALADARTYVGLSSPTRRVIKPEYPEDAPGSWIPSQLKANLAPLDYLASGPTFRIGEIPLLSNATRFLRLDGLLDLGGKLEAVRVTGADGRRHLRVRNETRFPMSLCFVASPTGFTSPLALLESGQSRVFELTDSEWQATPVTFTRKYADQDQESSDPVFNALPALLIQTPTGGGHLVARLESPLSTSSIFGPVRHSLGFLILEVIPEENL